ncbi:MAG: hypothetical protein D3906_10320, partial [Candidatus Electrothrix sp. AUS1_2]|nr:hypothetical protein [Candidatus Electrothrix sp. AUS1_2]
RKTLLLKKLGSCKRIMEATVDELSAVPGIGRKTAESVYGQLHEGQDGVRAANRKPDLQKHL